MENKAARKSNSPQIGILSMDVREENGYIIAEGRCTLRLVGGSGRLDTEQLRIDIPPLEDEAEISFAERYGTKLPGGYCLNRYRLRINIEAAKDYDVQNRVVPVYQGKYEGRFLYRFADLRQGRNRNSRIILADGLAMYFRQTKYNTLKFTVRDPNQYDTAEGQQRLARAKRNSRRLRGRDFILMYEKNCERYEESASVLYEKLIDEGHDNVYYIVDKSIDAVRDLPQKYAANLIQKDSDQHLEYFFACKKFISSETIDHAMQLRVASKDVQDKINGRGLSYVFLQHGVMYMVSLSSKLRSGFRQKSGYKIHRTVVSSEAEARHFIDMAGMQPGDLYITGLAKFDRCYANEGADRIIIMPTWRRWETNQAKTDIRDTGYYRMIETMYSSVPEELRDKVIILPHPLMAERFEGSGDGIGSRIVTGRSYDELFRDCRLLITDYSSIAYDAFYRGANVVFWWKDRDECMEHYGEDTILMLNEDNVFGPVCMNADELSAAVSERYGSPQTGQEKERYSQIVEFHDGRNSERIIALLKRDGIIS